MEEAAKTLVNIGQLVGGEFQKLRGVGGEVARLRNELATINALLRMQSEADEAAVTVSHFVREWMKQLREVGYDAEDCVDLYRCRVRCRSADPLLMRWKRLLGTLWARHRLAGDIGDLRSLASAINEHHARYGGVSLESRLGRSTAASDPAVQQAVAVSAACPPHRPSADNDDDCSNRFVGNKALAVDLASKVKALRNDDDKKLKVFSIWGFGGLGKTTLAMEVCRQLEADFPWQAHASVSQVFDLKGLLKRVLQQIVEVKAADRVINSNEQAHPLGNIHSMEVDDLVKKLKATLTDKRYLIVIDDLWTVPAWNVIQTRLPLDSNCGSRIIVTTRIDTVAKACSSANASDYYIHHIQPLNEENSKELFLSRVSSMVDPACLPQLEDVMEEVLRKCGGLPLAIISIAGLLASYSSPGSQHMWKRVLRSIGSQMESDPSLEGMRQIITLSYDHLPHHLKGCMMYLSIFPEDHIIGKDRLLRRWIAEGLVAEKRGMTLMEVAEGYFNELVSRSMIDRAADIVSNLCDGRDETCRVHDMMLEVMVSKSLEANFVSLIGGQFEGMSSYDRVRRLSVHGGGRGVGVVEASSSSSIKELNVQHVRSLSMFELQASGHNLLDRIGEFTLLRVLDLEDCMCLKKKHLRSICQLYLLRFLSLKGTNIKALPSAVGRLEHLQTLDVRLTLLTTLPNSVTKLEKLESLQSSKKDTFFGFRWEAPKDLGKMKALRKLHTVTVARSNTVVIEDIGKLEQLQELTICVERDIPEKDQEKLNLSLSRLQLLRRLNIETKSNDQSKPNFLHHLESPPRLLTHLRLCGTLEGPTGMKGGHILTAWVGLLAYLVDITIAHSHLRGDTLFDVLCTLRNLKMLTLESYFYDDPEVVAKTGQSFPVLTELRLFNNDGVPEVYRFEMESMPKLENLVVKFNGYSKQTFDGIENLTSLKEVQLTGKEGNKSMKDELEKLKQENERRSSNGSNRIKVIVRHDSVAGRS